jgi:hypothetical protein
MTRCQHCRQPDPWVRHVRLEFVGLRWLCIGCVERLSALGMYIVEVTAADPRAAAVPVAVDRRHPLRMPEPARTDVLGRVLTVIRGGRAA